MKPIIRELLVFGSGLIIGAITANKFLETKYEAIVQDEIESIREHVKARTRRRSEGENSDLGVGESYATPEELEMLREQREKDKEMKKAERELAEAESPEDDRPEKVDYTKFSKAGARAQTVVNIFEGRNLDNDPDFYDKNEPNEQERAEEPYVISFDEFSEGDEYDKVTLQYYDRDDVLTEENDQMVTDGDQLIGDGLEHFDEGEDPDTVYVRNEKMGIDYEVIRLHKSYQEEVLGIKQQQRYHGTPAKRAVKRGSDAE